MTTIPSRRSGYTILLIAATLAFAATLSFTQGMRQQVGDDFHVFWQAGHNFATGNPLYHGYLPSARPFIYPPFAALVFQTLAVFPFRVAAVLFSLLNLVLWVAAVCLTRNIVARTFPDRNLAALPLALAVVCSAQFFLDNFHHVQMNEVIFVLLLLGINAYLCEKDVKAAAYFVVATAIKITPIFFVVWLVIRGRRRAVFAVLPLALACVLVPLLVRGPATGAAELGEYYTSFLEGHQHGEVSTWTSSQNLGALVYRMMRPGENAEHFNYMYLAASERTAQLTYKISWAALLLLFLVTLGFLRARRAPLSAFEFSAIFLISFLLSPVTWKAHLVALLFVFYTFLAVRPTTFSPAGRLVAAVLGMAILVTGLSGRDLVGSVAYLYISGYSIFVWTMLLLFITAVALAGRESPDQRLAPALGLE